MDDARKTLINLCASMGLADDMSDVADVVWKALKDIGIKPPDDVTDLGELMAWLRDEHGATSIWGTSLAD